MSSLLEHVEHNILSRDLLKRGQQLAVAVSGGLDSTVLLAVLHRLSVRHGWRLLVLHFNHRLRGRSSDADERFVQRFARRLGSSAVTERSDVKREATAQKLSIEMAARRLRHNFFARVAAKHRIPAVALAHHADDQVELFFLRLFRGAGGEGLAGMPWSAPSPADARVRLVRPLLDISKPELEEFARKERIEFREDATNVQLDFDRNRIRLDLLPRLERDFAPALRRAVLRAMEITGAESNFVEQAASAWLKRPSRVPFGKLHIAVQRRVLLEQLIKSGTEPAFDLIERLRLNANQKIMAAPGRVLWRDSDGMLHEERLTEADAFDTTETRCEISKPRGRVGFDGCMIAWQIERHLRNARTIQREHHRECFDAAKVGPTVILRHWCPGDRFQPIGMDQPVKLQDWFVNQKIPRAQRRRLVVATNAAGEIFWVEDQRIGETCKITAATKSVMHWRWRRSADFQSAVSPISNRQSVQ